LKNYPTVAEQFSQGVSGNYNKHFSIDICIILM
jgi:hypothetical protein